MILHFTRSLLLLVLTVSPVFAADAGNGQHHDCAENCGTGDMMARLLQRPAVENRLTELAFASVSPADSMQRINNERQGIICITGMDFDLIYDNRIVLNGPGNVPLIANLIDGPADPNTNPGCIAMRGTTALKPGQIPGHYFGTFDVFINY